MPEETPKPPLDGIAPPAPAAQVRPNVPQAVPVASQTGMPPGMPPLIAPKKPKKSGISPMLIVLGVFMFLYCLPALALVSIFPTPDGSLQELKFGGIAMYGVGLLSWGVLGFLGIVRIGSFKDKPKMQRMALLRLAIVEVPMIIISGATIGLISLPPKLSLDIVDPKTAAGLIAPVSITFGADTANKIFASQKLKPIKYEWDSNGDGIIEQETFEPRATFIFQKAGIYQIAMRATMGNGQTRRVTSRLVLSVSSFGVEPGKPIIDEPANFSIENLFPKTEGSDSKTPKLVKAKWDFDSDGNVDVETDKMTAAYTYHKLGPANPSVVVLLSNQAQGTYKRLIEVVEPPKQPFPITLETEPSTLLGPVPFGILFTLKTSEPIANVSWQFGNQKTGEGLRVAHVYNDVGNYTVTALARSQSGATAKLTKVVRVTPSLDIRDLGFEGRPDVRNFEIKGQIPLTVNITPVTTQPLISFSWDAPKASEILTTDKTLHAVYREEGTYYADIIGIDPEQNVMRKRITIIVEKAASTASFSMNPPTPTAPATVQFDASDTYVRPDEEISGFEWDFGERNVPGAQAEKYTGSRTEYVFKNPGTYIVKLTVRTTSGQTYIDEKQLVVRAPLIDVCFMPSRRTGKAPLAVRFDTACSVGEFSSWLWDFGDGGQSDQQNVMHTFLRPGDYKVKLTATSKNNLSSTKDTIVSVSE